MINNVIDGGRDGFNSIKERCESVKVKVTVHPARRLLLVHPARASVGKNLILKNPAVLVFDTVYPPRP